MLILLFCVFKVLFCSSFVEILEEESYEKYDLLHYDDEKSFMNGNGPVKYWSKHAESWGGHSSCIIGHHYYWMHNDKYSTYKLFLNSYNLNGKSFDFSTELPTEILFKEENVPKIVCTDTERFLYLIGETGEDQTTTLYKVDGDFEQLTKFDVATYGSYNYFSDFALFKHSHRLAMYQVQKKIMYIYDLSERRIVDSIENVVTGLMEYDSRSKLVYSIRSFNGTFQFYSFSDNAEINVIAELKLPFSGYLGLYETIGIDSSTNTFYFFPQTPFDTYICKINITNGTVLECVADASFSRVMTFGVVEPEVSPHHDDHNPTKPEKLERWQVILIWTGSLIGGICVFCCLFCVCLDVFYCFAVCWCYLGGSSRENDGFIELD